MFVLIKWLRKYSYPLVAFLLFGFSVNQILRYQIYQHSVYFQSSITFFRTIDVWKSNFVTYFQLRHDNEILANENIRLRNQLKIGLVKNEPFRDTSYFDSVSKELSNYRVMYSYIKAKVIRNTTNSSNNFFTIDQGKNQGIYPGMAVINPEGIVGVIVGCSQNFSRGMSVLNSKFGLTPLIPEMNLRQGVINWKGANARIVDLDEINRTEKIKQGMIVVTSNFSSIFPANIPIGKIEKVESPLNSQYHKISLKLATNFNKLNTVYCIKNNFNNEIDSLNSGTLNLSND